MMKRSRWFFVVMVPLAWSVCSLVHFNHPGDEYGLYFVGSAIGSWSALVLPFDDIHNPLLRGSIALTGGVLMAGVGFWLDRMRVRSGLWICVFGIAIPVTLFLAINAYPSTDAALRKNGSWSAYLCFSIQIAMYVAVVVCAQFAGLSAAISAFVVSKSHRQDGRQPPVR